MTDFQGVVIGLLVMITIRSYANGHDIRNDWSGAERAACFISAVAGAALVGIYGSRWAL